MTAMAGDRLRGEWLEADGLGGFASGPIAGPRTRRYHALLLAALTPPTGRHVFVNGFDAFVETRAGSFALTSQKYLPDFVHPEGARQLVAFRGEPWPAWTFRLEDGTEIVEERFVVHGSPLVAVTWRLQRGPRRGATTWLSVRPFLSGRDAHSLQKENGALLLETGLDAKQAGADARVTWRPYASLPGVVARANGTWRADPQWYRNFLYDEELSRGLDATEDLAAPGTFTFDLAAGEAVWLVGLDEPGVRRRSGFDRRASVAAVLQRLRAAERTRRRAFKTPLERAADAYLVRRGRGLTLIAGYPWFTDWGRDTFIALRGLLLATGRRAEAAAILRQWSGALSQGMVPNRFSEDGNAPEYNSVDASLWFVVAVQELLAARRRATPGATRGALPAKERSRLLAAVAAILDHYQRGTRFGIRADADGLLAAGAPGQQLTWMDARVDGREVTSRNGKPVEVQALWINALAFAATALPDRGRWRKALTRARAAFERRFWNEAAGCLFDVVDVDHQPGVVDGSLRPNQLFAIGGLPLQILKGERARRVVTLCEAKLLIPGGLRSLAPDDPVYRGRYAGGPAERDAAYHQGIAWPWLLGPFVEAWLRVHGNTAARRRAAHKRFLEPLLRRMDEAGVHHLAELADGDAPHAPRGSPFQAWSLGELLRLVKLLRIAAKA